MLKGFRTTLLVCIVLSAAFIALGVRCFHLQHNRYDHYTEACLRQQKSRSVERSQRGTIVDAAGRLVSDSVRNSLIFVDSVAARDLDETCNRLGQALDLDPHMVSGIIANAGNPRFIPIKTDATPAECNEVSSIRGVGVQHDWKRNYPMGPLLAHPVGFTSRDHRGLEGIELFYNGVLTGSPGSNIMARDVARRPLMRLEKKINPIDGAGLILTVDATIQEFARSALLEQYEAYEAESAVAIVADPRTGDILAMVSLPDFNPADLRYADPNTFRNRALTDQFEPGSVVKPFMAAIALDAGVINMHEKIFCEYGNYRGRGFGRIGEYRRGFGDLTVKEILIKSSNIGMAKIGQRLGKKRLYEGVKRFGFGEKTGVDLPVEKTGRIWPLSRWNGYSETRIPFGQEMTVTAMQLVRAMCILANGGYSVQLRVVKAVVDSDGRTERNDQVPTYVGAIIKRKVADWLVQEALSAVVNEGTGKRAKNDKWQVFGKTGTANIALENGRGFSDNDYVASFICGAPAEDPRVVVLVSVRKPNKKLGKGYTGGVVAAPVAGEIIDRTLTYLEANEAIGGRFNPSLASSR